MRKRKPRIIQPELDIEDEDYDLGDEYEDLFEDQVDGKIHICQNCGEEFSEPSQFIEHAQSCPSKKVIRKTKKEGDRKRKINEADRKYRCRVCLRAFGSKNHFDRHMKKHEQRLNLQDEMACPECDVRSKKIDLNEHYREKHDQNKGICLDCSKLFPVSELFYHVAKHFINTKKHLCNICGEKFRTPLDLRVHQSYHDSKETSVVCDQCGKVYTHRKRLVRHIRVSHNKSKKYPCHLCDKVFYENHRLAKHLTIHSANKPFCCVHCPFRSVRRDNVLLHVRKIHKKESRDSDVIKDGQHNVKGTTSLDLSNKL